MFNFLWHYGFLITINRNKFCLFSSTYLTFVDYLRLCAYNYPPPNISLYIEVFASVNSPILNFYSLLYNQSTNQSIYLSILNNSNTKAETQYVYNAE